MTAPVLPGIGHNLGPTMEEGTSWRRHCWTEARRALLPTLPLEVLRLRVARAREIGLDYRTYATVRATSGRDIVAFLFSSNALRLFAPQPLLPEDRAARLAAMAGCGRIAVVHRPLSLTDVPAPPLDWAMAAPGPNALWRDVRGALRGALQAQKLPVDAVLLVGDTPLERAWAEAGALAGYLPTERFFTPPTP